MKAYPNYKNSGVLWLGGVPEHWEVRRTKYILKETDRRSNNGAEQLLSVSQYTGVTPRKKKENSDIVDSRASSLVGYKVVQESDLVVNIMLAWNGSLGVSPYSGIVSPAYCIYRFSSEVLPKYYHYLYKTDLYKTTFKAYSTGVVESRLRLYSDKLGSIESLLPPLNEQQQISRYLDWQTSKINRFIKAKKKLIALLKEQKQNVINEAVTKGINPDVEMKDSGVEWLGEIPAHWAVRRTKFLCKIKTGGRDTVDKKDGGEISIFRSFTKKLKVLILFSFEGEAVLTAGDGAGVAKVFHYFNGKFEYHQRVYKFSNFSEVIGKYFYHYLKDNLRLVAFRETAKSTVDSLRLPMLQNFPVLLPSMSEQNKIVAHIEKETALIDKTITRTEQEIELIQEYRTRLVSDVVTGKVDVSSVEIPDFEPVEADLEAQDDEESEDELITEGIVDE